jgi:hypothetical protein
MCMRNLELGLWCIAPLSTLFPLYRGGQFVLAEETGVAGQNYQPVASHWQTLSLNEYRVHLAWTGF